MSILKKLVGGFFKFHKNKFVIPSEILLYFCWVFYFSLPIKDVTVNSGEKVLFVKVMTDIIDENLKSWTPNDITIPHALRDDIVEYQHGVWEIMRHSSRVLRDNMSRMRTSDRVNEDCQYAFNQLNINTTSWLLPRAESEYRKARNALTKYREDCLAGKQQFYTNAFNLEDLMRQYGSALGGIYNKLNSATQSYVLSTENEGDTSTGGEKMVDVSISWFETDDNFYRAKGAALTLCRLMQAIRIDYIEVLKDKKSVDLVDKVIEILEEVKYQKPFYVFNNSPRSPLPLNHSRIISSYIQDARQRITSLIVALKQG